MVFNKLIDLYHTKRYHEYCSLTYKILKTDVAFNDNELPKLIELLISASIITSSVSLIVTLCENDNLAKYIDEQTLNTIIKYLNSIEQYDISLRICVNSVHIHSQLIKCRIEEIENLIASKCDFLPYFRSHLASFNFEDKDVYLVDSIEFAYYMELDDHVKNELIRNGTPDYFPKSISQITGDDRRLQDVIVLPDMSILEPEKRIIHYEGVKAVPSGWTHNLPSVNNFFRNYSYADGYSVIKPANVETICSESAFLIPNPVDGIGHFIHDALPALASFRRYLSLNDTSKVLMKKNREYDRSAVNHLVNKYFQPKELIEIDNVCIECQQLYMPPPIFVPRYFSYNKKALLESKLLIDEAASPINDSFPVKIYISRRDGNNNSMGSRDIVDRAILNSGILERAGFTIIELSTLEPEEQIVLFQGATHVAGIHGAGLMNIIFSQKGRCSVTEILAEPWSYYTIAMFSTFLEMDYMAFAPNEIVTEGTLSELGYKNLFDRLAK
jgi:hypothetical protein